MVQFIQGKDITLNQLIETFGLERTDDEQFSRGTGARSKQRASEIARIAPFYSPSYCCQRFLTPAASHRRRVQRTFHPPLQSLQSAAVRCLRRLSTVPGMKPAELSC